MAFSKSATSFTNSGFSMYSAKVLSEQSGQFHVLMQTGQFQQAVVAASCLVVPELNSQVLVASGEQQCYIIAVLTTQALNIQLNAKNIALNSEALKIHNKQTEVKTNEWRFDVRRLVSLAKRAYAEFGQLWQKTDAAYVESKHYKLKTDYLAEETKGLRLSQADVMTDKAKVSSIQSDKFLIG